MDFDSVMAQEMMPGQFDSDEEGLRWHAVYAVLYEHKLTCDWFRTNWCGQPEKVALTWAGWKVLEQVSESSVYEQWAKAMTRMVEMVFGEQAIAHVGWDEELGEVTIVVEIGDLIAQKMMQIVEENASAADASWRM
jgi:hypothetical protein